MPAIVFDWDGTLVDTLPAITRANIAVMASYGLPYDPVAFRLAYTPDWQTMYVRLGIAADRVLEAGARWVAAYRSEVDAARAFPGAMAALERLADAGYRMALVTAGERDIVIGQLESTGLGRHLPVRVCAGDLPVNKPHPGPLLRALTALGVVDRAAETTYVGDSADDMRMARTVGARAVGIPSLMGTGDDLVAAGAMELAPSVADWVDRFLESR